MTYVKTLKNMLVLLAVLLLNSVGFAGHTSAMSTMTHEMIGTSHKTDTSASCATLCRTAVVERETVVIRNNENNDEKEPITPFYLQNQSHYFSQVLAGQKQYADSVKPPPKIPIHIQLQVFRI